MGFIKLFIDSIGSILFIDSSGSIFIQAGGNGRT